MGMILFRTKAAIFNLIFIQFMNIKISNVQQIQFRRQKNNDLLYEKIDFITSNSILKTHLAVRTNPQYDNDSIDKTDRRDCG